MSSNFLIFNPGSSNQETDAAYSGDAQRSGGFQPNQEVPSPLLNKMAFQSSTGVYALMDALASLGYTVADSDPAAIVTAILSAFGGNLALQSLAFTATPAWDATANSTFEMTLTGNVTSQTISGVTPGQLVTFIWTQDATGSRTVVYPSIIKGSSSVNGAPNSTTTQTFRADSAGNLWAVSGAIVSNA